MSQLRRTSSSMFAPYGSKSAGQDCVQKKYPISPLLLQEIAYWTFFYHKLAVHREMQYRFQTAHYQLLVKVLDLGFRYNSLFAMNADGTIEHPIIKFGKLRMTRVTTDMYGRQSDRPLIKVLLGYGFIFIKNHLYFRLGISHIF